MQKSFQNQDSAECSKNDEIDTMHLHQENELHWGPESAKNILFLQKMPGCAKIIGRRIGQKSLVRMLKSGAIAGFKLSSCLISV